MSRHQGSLDIIYHIMHVGMGARSEILTLYRRLLRLQDRLPREFSALGRKFVQEEFKRHKTASQEQAAMFTREWTVSVCHCLVSAHNVM